MKTDLTLVEIELLAQAVSMQANWIETHNPLLSAEDMKQRDDKPKIRRLLIDEKEKVQKLRSLMGKLVQEGMKAFERATEEYNKKNALTEMCDAYDQISKANNDGAH
jgi:hypothetical protein